MKRTILLILAFAVSILCFTSCEKETPSVGSLLIGGKWKCTVASSNSNAFFIEGDIIEFKGDGFELVHPDGKSKIGRFKLNETNLILITVGGEEISFNVDNSDSRELHLNQGRDFRFTFKRIYN